MLDKENLTFENLPEAISYLIKEVEKIKQAFLKGQACVLNGDNHDKQKKEILTVEDVCQMLDIKKGSVYNLTHKRAIPFYKRGQRVYFDKDEIDRWVRSNKRKTICELKEDADKCISSEYA